MKHQYIYFYPLIILFLITGCSHEKVQSPTVIEIIDLDYRFSTKSLLNFSKDNNIDNSSIYEWQNHWVIYCDMKDAENLKTKLESCYPRLIIKVYNEPFYNFKLQKHCNKKPADEWDNIIMTANLVNDATKQKEYLEYHRTQFEKWPEIAKGFCNANFQQLLVFRNGRQLMLIISIPKGESLDKLNPKTIENNPRVNEWNTIMSKYQVGIDDAPKGTTWLVFEKINKHK